MTKTHQPACHYEHSEESMPSLGDSPVAELTMIQILRSLRFLRTTVESKFDNWNFDIA